MTLPPLLFALVAWFVGTGVVVWLDTRARTTFALSHALAAIAAVAACVGIWLLRDDGSVAAAYAGFALAIVVWGFHELGFLMGFVAGPNRAACPPDAHGWRRFRLATATVIHHEVALAATLALLTALTWGSINQAAPLTFGLLFVMRLSAKLNLFLGVANLSDEIFPAHLAYLKSYFGPRPVNWLFPFSLALGLGLAYWGYGVAEATTGGAAVTASMLAALAMLGTVEHLFLVLPLRDGAMWRWAIAKPIVITGGESRNGR